MASQDQKKGQITIMANNIRGVSHGQILEESKWTKNTAGGKHVQNGSGGGVSHNTNKERKPTLELRVLKVDGPFDPETGKKVDVIEKGKRYYFKVIQYNRPPEKEELKNLKWGFQHNDGAVKSAPQVNGLEMISDYVAKEENVDKLRVYAFFKAPNKNASVEVNVRNEFYRFNPQSYKAGQYSKKLDNSYHTRENWGAKPPILDNRSFEPYTLVTKYVDKNTKDQQALPTLEDTYFGIAIHHSGNSGIKTMTEVQDEHINGKNKFADVGYHFGIDLSGKVYEGRYIGVKGSHLTKYNTGVIGIVFLADFDHDYFWDYNGDDNMSPASLTSAILLINGLKEQFPKITTLGGHNEWKNNVGERRCPGDYGMEYVKALRKQLGLKSPKETGHG
ncbi:peptidoglycan recognition protein family protein [Chryseobacterium daecheongense]|uniref:peptidoglycan recognition protein family protein n=1 Tax=Chryseobacterium daecheongense TaxID=192389 RepID=UPI001FD6B178|nr:peptidoglycan recognition family protein [Chryseobacterium daecheongense]UOU98476.1 peptidoglycan recognition protein family protein [Chryseobacterium daecheongense]